MHRTMNLSVRGRLWKYPGTGGWYFVNIEPSKSIRIKADSTKYGAGFVKVEAKIGTTKWITALFPQNKTKSYLLSIKSSIRKKEGLLEGDTVSVKLRLV